MKYFAYLAISIMTIALISLFYLKKPDGKTWLSVSSMSDKSHHIKEKIVTLTGNTFDNAVHNVKQASEKIVSSTASNSKIFKWQDDTGQWHFSDTPNPHAKSIEVKLNPKDITVIAAEDTSILNNTPKVSSMSAASETISILDPDSVQKLFEDAGSVQDKLEKRNKEINSLSGL